MKKLFTNLGWRSLLYLLGLLIVVGIVAENQPWGRGWVHDLKYAAHCNFSRGSFSSSPAEYTTDNNYYEYPDEPSPEMKSLQVELDQWYPTAIEATPCSK